MPRLPVLLAALAILPACGRPAPGEPAAIETSPDRQSRGDLAPVECWPGTESVIAMEQREGPLYGLGLSRPLDGPASLETLRFLLESPPQAPGAPATADPSPDREALAPVAPGAVECWPGTESAIALERREGPLFRLGPAVTTFRERRSPDETLSLLRLLLDARSEEASP